MVAELVRRLSQAGVVSRDTLAQALFESSTTGAHLLHVLAERNAETISLLEAELARDRGPNIAGPLPIDFLQVLRLPVGLCKRLLAVPLQVEATSSRWAIAVADISDRHVAAEISYHLGGPVDVRRAQLGVMLEAVALTEERPFKPSGYPLMEVDDEHTPAFGTAAIMHLRRPSARWSVSENSAEERRPTPRRGLSLPPVQATESQSEPPIPLVRPIPHRAVQVSESPRETPTVENAADQSSARQFQSRRELASPSGITPQEKTAEILSELENKKSPKEVLLGFGRAVSVVARRAAVFAVRSGNFELEYIFPAHLANKLSFSSTEPSVLQTACQAGYYLGPLPRGPQSDALVEALGIDADSEIYIVPVVVAERPAALIMAGLIDNTFAATRLIDQIAKRGSSILEKLVHQRRRPR